MTDISIGSVPQGFHLLRESGFADPSDPNRPNRLCVCFSDVHFTDGTVGNQSADDVVWEEVVDTIMDLCVDNHIAELTVLLAGDVVDMIRTSRWAENGVYPWQRDHPQFKPIVRAIVDGIIAKHARPPDSDDPCAKTGFFFLLRKLREDLMAHDCRMRTLVLLGNHDKEILADAEALRNFYEKCLGQPLTELSDGYRDWIGAVYFGDSTHFRQPDSVPWLPFYWGDAGFRLFVTHGQWRDQDNSRGIEPQAGQPGWQVSDGWLPDIWQALHYQPFTAACFGDTVAAGLLSGFIYRAKKKLEELHGQMATATALSSVEKQQIEELGKVLDELDLYRPTYAAIRRIIEKTAQMRRMDGALGRVHAVIDVIEKELADSTHTWLGWEFTFSSATTLRRWILRPARLLMKLIKLFGARVELRFLYAVMWLLGQLQRWHRNEPSYAQLLDFPAFLEQYRTYGFRIHGEGHTHIPLECELHFKTPSDNPNYTYINFGAWRDQLVPKQMKGYRRRGVGRILCILDRQPDPRCPEQEAQRRFDYWVQDALSWSGRADRL